MDLKIKVTCHKCKCAFEFRPIEKANQEYICPNCREVIKPEIASHIANGISELKQIPDEYGNKKDNENIFDSYIDGFSFEIVLPKEFKIFT